MRRAARVAALALCCVGAAESNPRSLSFCVEWKRLTEGARSEFLTTQADLVFAQNPSLHSKWVPLRSCFSTGASAITSEVSGVCEKHSDDYQAGVLVGMIVSHEFFRCAAEKAEQPSRK